MKKCFVSSFLFLVSSFIAFEARGYADSAMQSRDEWQDWSGRWSGNYWNEGNFGHIEQDMSCVAVDGSHGGPEFWARGSGNQAARAAYEECLKWANVADRNIVFIEVTCGY